ncbi:hypothetical protein BJ085DRAFT_30523 [Dimargaris cristalligena]|uniref:Thioredoxin domain-containing protein n=1 Tax=Dimargaris cristalligena TaxID=215637 RepID=A0A4P9ZPW5_9FUNG|nr:hypothetical protein BJ085DRAFT_30523 [Dimargaris cristalligena]|eukprot:RKP35496.1 hypothetical protein BJ085DRAFT_30523 [Dimargaris cristalligena]
MYFPNAICLLLVSVGIATAGAATTSKIVYGVDDLRQSAATPLYALGAAQPSPVTGSQTITEFHQGSSGKRMVVFYYTSCPKSRKFLPEYGRFARDFKKCGITFGEMNCLRDQKNLDYCNKDAIGLFEKTEKLMYPPTVYPINNGQIMSECKEFNTYELMKACAPLPQNGLV